MRDLMAGLNALPEEQRADFAAESPQAADRLAALKGRIEQSGLSLRRDYPDPQAVQPCKAWF